MEKAKTQAKSVAARPARSLIPVSEQSRLSLEELAQAILDRRVRPGVVQLRRLAEAVLASGTGSRTPSKRATGEKASKDGGKSKKAAKAEKKKGKKSKRRKLAKIPKAKS